MMASETDSLIIFVKYPEKGKVKSRLAAAWDGESVVELYKCFVEDLLQTMRESGFKPVVAFFPAEAKEKIVDWLGSEYRYFPQSGNNLGERMKNAFRYVFEHGSLRAVLIGSDIPDLKAEIIRDAFMSLGEHDAVVGPSLDGGYYLIGFPKDSLMPRIFDGIPWSTDEVLLRTMEIFMEEGRRVRLMPARRDIDRPEDVEDLIGRNIVGPFRRSKTMAFLLKHER